MQLKYKVNIVGLGILLVVALAVAFAGVLTIERQTYDLNRKLLSAEVSNLVEKGREARNTLVESGVARVAGYVEKAQADLLRQFKGQARDRFGRLTIVDMHTGGIIYDDFLATESSAITCLPDMLKSGNGEMECVWQDHKQFFFYKAFPEWQWMIVLSMARSEMFAMHDVFVRNVLGILVLSTVVGWIVFIRFAGSIVGPLLKLSTAAKAMSQGRWDNVPLTLDRGDEIGDLARAFAEMGSRLSAAYHDLERQTGVLKTANDSLNIEITERKRAQDDLVRARDAFQNILDSMPSVVIGVDEEARVTNWNRTAKTVTGLSGGQVRGRPLAEVFPRLANHMDAVWLALRQGEPVSRIKLPFTEAGRLIQEDLMVFPLVSGGVHGAVVRLDDVTERARLEDMMVQTEKMMSVGGLAAGMAHEINNPLGGILQSAQVITRRLLMDSPANQEAAAEAGSTLPAIRRFLEKREIVVMLDGIRSSAARAAQIVANMLEFSRKSETTKRSVELASLLDRAVELCSSDYDMNKRYDFRQIAIRREYDPALPRVLCTPTEIEQVVMNILRNAAQAMAKWPDVRAPAITMRTRREGAKARIEVEDNGPGMDAEIRRKVFEPFFSTKPPGEGTGLGLSVSYYIVTHNHGGTLQVESTPGKGATFIIHLPLAQDSCQGERLPPLV